MGTRDLNSQLSALAALADPVRRRLYQAVADSAAPLSRDQAARAGGVSRALAAFHLEKLVEAGLLEASFRRLTGRSGPGAGRPAKLYARSARVVDVSLPARRYEWAARMLAGALAGSLTAESQAALRRSARAQGDSIGRERRDERARSASPAPALGEPANAPADSGHANGPSGSASDLDAAQRALADCGFEPVRVEGGDVLLRNCPFDRLRENCRELICDMNLSLITGVLDGLGTRDVSAALEPRPGHCCVVLRERS